jgi:CheY-like chemotaxis protein
VTPDADGVLVIEDDVDILRAIVQVLEDEGHAVRGAANGQAALDLLRQPRGKRPRLILLDLMMPIMDGWAFRAEQLRDPALADIPVIVLTADGGAEETGQRMKCAGALRKPVALTDLLIAVEPYLVSPR